MLSQLLKTCFVFGVISLMTPSYVYAQYTNVQKKEIALEVVKIFKLAKEVVHQAQDLINDETKGYKEFTGKLVIRKTQQLHRELMSPTFDRRKYALYDDCQRNLYASIYRVVEDAQFLINEEGKGFKGFISAVFARRVADEFNKRMSGRAMLKLTAPKKVLRHKLNRPDDWEEYVFRNKFLVKYWPKDQEFAEVVDVDEKNAFRMMLPIYHEQSCLQCHGEPEGEKDITGGEKEGAKEGDLAGAISLILF